MLKHSAIKSALINTTIMHDSKQLQIRKYFLHYTMIHNY